MQLREIQVEGYRSLKSIRLPVDALTVLVGENGVGKSNIYRALALLQRAAEGTITEAIAEEGGLESVLWAGSRERVTQRLVLTATSRTPLPNTGATGPPTRSPPMIRRAGKYRLVQRVTANTAAWCKRRSSAPAG